MGTNYNRVFNNKPRFDEFKVDVKPNDEDVIDTLQPTTTKEKKAKVINCSRLNVRQKPDIQSVVTTIVDMGVEISVDTVIGDWTLVHVDLPNTDLGVSGYVMSKYIEIQEG